MKAILLITALFTSSILGGAAYKKFFSPATATENEVKTTVSQVNIQNHTLAGNLVDQRNKDATTQLVSLEKHILKTNLNTKRVVYFNDVFQFDTVQRAIGQMKQLEAESSDPIWLLIDSPGGSVMDGALLISQMEASKAPVFTVCTRLCASMAAMTHSYGAKRYALDRAVLMYHPASASAGGQVKNMMSQMATMNRYIEKMVSNVVKRSHITQEEYDRLVPHELWVDAEDSLQKGLIEGIVNLNVPSYPPQAAVPGQSEGGERIKRATKFDMISPHIELWEDRE